MSTPRVVGGSSVGEDASTAITQPIPTVGAPAPAEGGPAVGGSGGARRTPGTVPPAGMTAPGTASAPAGERCPQCASPLAHDQRYCLRCGAPRTYLGGLAHGMRPTAPQSPPAAPPRLPGQPTAGGGIGSLHPSTLLAAVAVLLLAMGIGVLIGRSGGGSSSKTPATQVISVPAATTGSSTTSTPSETASSAKKGKTSSSSKKSTKGKGEASGGSGNSISKPAPPSAAQELSKAKTGKSYEQASKNLPNVIES